MIDKLTIPEFIYHALHIECLLRIDLAPGLLAPMIFRTNEKLIIPNRKVDMKRTILCSVLLALSLCGTVLAEQAAGMVLYFQSEGEVYLLLAEHAESKRGWAGFGGGAQS